MKSPTSTAETEIWLPTLDGKPLRILHVLDHSLPLYSGYTFRTLSILREQRVRGWQTFHLTGPKQGEGEAAEERVGEWMFERTRPRHGPLAHAPLARHWLVMRALAARIEEVTERVKPHIIHAHSPVLNGLPALTVGREKGIPVVYEIRAFWEDAAADHGTASERSLRYRLTRALETRAARRADAVTTICEGLRADLVGRGIPAEKIMVIPNAVDISRFQIQTQPDRDLIGKYDLQSGATLGFAGSFYAYEGLNALIRAMPQVVRSVPQVRLLLVGGGPQEVALKTLSVQLGLQRVVHFTGPVPHEDISRYYSVMDVMVYPRISRRLTELVTPLKPLEAMALGKPVAASNVGGHRELIRDGETGYLFRAGSPQILADCLLGVLRDSGAWPRIAGAARRFVETELNWRSSVARYHTVYERVLSRRKT